MRKTAMDFFDLSEILARSSLHTNNAECVGDVWCDTIRMSAILHVGLTDAQEIAYSQMACSQLGHVGVEGRDDQHARPAVRSANVL